jgi:phage shock protein E
MGSKSIKDKIEAGATIIDVRTPDEFADGAYAGAKNIPVQALLSRFGEIGPKDKPVIVYCASGSRSAAAMAILKQKGYTDVLNAGGLEDMPS